MHVRSSSLPEIRMPSTNVKFQWNAVQEFDMLFSSVVLPLLVMSPPPPLLPVSKSQVMPLFPLCLSPTVSLRSLQEEVFDHAKQWLEALPVYARVRLCTTLTD